MNLSQYYKKRNETKKRMEALILTIWYIIFALIILLIGSGMVLTALGFLLNISNLTK